VVAQAPVEIKVPNWVSSRPNNGFKYVGIGFAEKKGGNYQMDAKKNALYDLASEIKVDISSNSVLYTVQNNNNFNENFNSLIKLSNSDNIEGYTLVDSYENDKQYWVYYQLHWLDLVEFKKLGVQYYDFCGWYAGETDEALLNVNKFKEQFTRNKVKEYTGVIYSNPLLKLLLRFRR
jgi:hypothetical protein